MPEGDGLTYIVDDEPPPTYWEIRRHRALMVLRKQPTLPVVGVAGSALTALAGAAYYTVHPITFGGYAVIQLICLIFHTVAVIPMLAPALTARLLGPGDVFEFHHTLTIITASGATVVSMIAAILFAAFDADLNSPAGHAIGLALVTLVAGCMAGGFGATFIPGAIPSSFRGMAGLPDEGGVDVDSDGFDGGH